MNSTAASSATVTGAATPADATQVVTQMLDGGSRYETLIKAFLVQVDGEPWVERYHPDSGPKVSGDIYSITQSVLSLLIGIAIDEGSIAAVDRTLAELLPQYVAEMAPGVGDVTLQQVLTMTGGLMPDDDANWPDPYSQPDWVAAMLATPLAQTPGTTFAGTSIGPHLLSAILATATGRTVLDFAREKVFGPLGIVTEPALEPVAIGDDWYAEYDAATGFAWPVDPQGLHLGVSDLKLTAPDLVKIGQLYLDSGTWQGDRIVSPEWIATSTSSLFATDYPTFTGYGYLWFSLTAGGHDAFASIGFAGQLLEVVPDLGLVVVVAAEDAPAAFGADSFAELVQRNLVPLLEG